MSVGAFVPARAAIYTVAVKYDMARSPRLTLTRNTSIEIRETLTTARSSMLKALHKVAIGLMIALGTLHVTFTPFSDGGLTLDALWFLGSGFAIILAGFLNVVLMIDVGGDKLVQLLCHVANVTFSVLFGVAVLLLPQPQVFVGLALFAVATITALMTGSRAETQRIG